MAEQSLPSRRDDDVWDRLQWRIHDMLRLENDPLLREALYRQGEVCIREYGDADDGFRNARLRHFQLAYLSSAERGPLALS